MKKRAPKSLKLGKKAAAVAITAIAAGSFFLYGARAKTPIQVPAYQVLRVIDGDTFETTEKQLIRLSDIEAPELEYCGGPQAKEELTKLILKKQIYLKVLYRDPYDRLISLVYTEDGSVNEHMLKHGWAAFRSKDMNDSTDTLQQAVQKAKDKKIGIFSDLCTQWENKKEPTCTIKGNNTMGKETKYYHTKGCQTYAFTPVELYMGDQWFCTEAEAQKAGYTKATQCP